MAILSSDITSNFVIGSFSGSIAREEHNIRTLTTTGAGKKVTFNNVFGSVYISAGDVLRVSDGVTTINYSTTDTEGANASGSTNIGVGSDRAATAVVDEFVSKINSSALDVTATDDGGSSTVSSFTLVPGAGKTLSVTEDPTGNSQFGTSSGFTVITDVAASTSTNTRRAAPFRFFTNGVSNIRGQDNSSYYKTFVGQHKN